MDRQSLRARAEQLATSDDEKIRALSPDEVRALFHELNVHQIELSLQNDEVLRAHRELQDLYNTAPVGLFTVDERGIIKGVNETLCKLLGCEWKDLTRRASVSLVLEDERGEFFRFRDRILHNQQATCQLHFRRLQGEAVHVSLSGRRVEDGSGALLRIAVVDISESERARERIDHLNTILRSMRDVGQLISREQDPDLLLDRACSLLTSSRGYESAWIVRFDTNGAFHAFAHAGLDGGEHALVSMLRAGEFPNCVKKILAGEHLVAVADPYEACPDCPLGQGRRLSGGIAAALRHGNRLHGVLVVSLPAVFVKHGEDEEALLTELGGDLGFALHAIERETQFRQLVDTMPTGTMIFKRTPSGKEFLLQQTNPAAEMILARSSNELIGHCPGEVFSDDDCGPLVDAMHAVLEDGHSRSLSARALTIGNATRWVEKRVLRLQGGCVAVLFEDRTEQRKLEDNQRHSQKMEAIGQLAGGIAHDFNNQLTGIMGYAEMLKGGVEDPDLIRYAENVLVASRHSASLTKELLAFSRRGKYERMPVNLHTVISHAVGILEHSIDKRITVQRNFSARSPYTVGDPGQLQNAFLNLGLNARDAMPEGGELRFSTAAMELDAAYCDQTEGEVQPGPYICITVQDSGCGIPKELQERIFEPFFTTKEPGKGTGMGLAAVYGTIHSHGGVISLSSEEGSGTSFTICLPHVTSTDENGGGAQHVVVASSKANIVVVDDEPMVADLLKDMLTSLGHEVCTFADGPEALEYFASHHGEVSLVILDMVLPRMDGMAIFRRMRNLDPEANILIASGYSIKGDADKLLQEGAVGFVQKPFNYAQLSQAVAEALA